MIGAVRTTLDIDIDILRAVKELAEQRGATAGRVLSELARQALQPAAGESVVRNGVPVFPPRPGERIVTPEDVERLLDEVRIGEPVPE